MKHKLLLIYAWFVRAIMFFWPDVPVVMRLRGWLYGLGMKYKGKDFQVTHDAIIKDLWGISVGNNVFVGNGTVIMGSGTIEIDDEVQFAPHCIIISGNHTMKNGSFRYGKGDSGHIEIGKGSWVAGNSTIQRGGRLPEGSVLSANSLLNKRFDEPFALYGGVPAKMIKKLDIC
jgi:maltose O-acetyltransferase